MDPASIENKAKANSAPLPLAAGVVSVTTLKRTREQYEKDPEAVEQLREKRKRRKKERKEMMVCFLCCEWYL